ncbi:hypothetical protein BH23BAC4_BH23BAC4_02490 [soil metagenome]
MAVSQHAYVRVQQRGLRIDDLGHIQTIGDPVRRPGGATEYRITKAVREREIRRLKGEIQKLDRLCGTAVLVSDEGTVITAYHLTGRS